MIVYGNTYNVLERKLGLYTIGSILNAPPLCRFYHLKAQIFTADDRLSLLILSNTDPDIPNKSHRAIRALADHQSPNMLVNNQFLTYRMMNLYNSRKPN